MYQKNCDKCNHPSFSSSEIGEWLCPVCGSNLTKRAFYDAMTLEQIHVLFKKIAKPHKYSIQQISKNYKKRVGLSYYSKKFDIRQQNP